MLRGIDLPLIVVSVVQLVPGLVGRTVGFIPGLAEREGFELALEKVRLGSSKSLAHRNVFQRELGRMEMAWRSVRSLFYDLTAEVWESVRAGHAETQE